jgi:hypothetical protein
VIPAAGQVFDASTGRWSPLPANATPREKPAAAFVGGKLYVIGGWGNSGTPVPAMEIYDPATNAWTTGPSVPNAYAASGIAVVGGKIYVIGGCVDTCGKNDVYAYDTAARSWSRVADYPLSTAWIACGGLSGNVYCAGGTNAAGDTKQGFSYDPGTDSWSPIADLPIDLWASGAAAANGKLFVSGGVTNGNTTLTNQGFAYDPTTKAWTEIANSNNAVYRGGSACGFYRVGGSTGGTAVTDKAEVLPGLDQCAEGAGDVTWLSEDPTKFTVAPGKSVTVTVTLDASVQAVAQPGTYAAALTFKTNTPYAVDAVDVKMNVQPPATWGKIAGTVTGVKCDGTSAPLAGATVQIDSWAQHYTLRTDANGKYALWLDERNSPIDVIAAKDGYQPKYKQYKITAGKTTTADWALKTAQAC